MMGCLSLRQHIAPIVVVLLLVSSLGYTGVVGAEGSPQSPTTDESLVAHQSTGEPGDISPQLTNASGTVEVIVELDALLQPSETRVTPATLKDRSDRSQASVRSFATDREGVEVVSDFWITNAVLLRIDTARVDLEEVAAIPRVQQINPNVKMSTLNTSAKSEPVTPSKTTDKSVTYGLEQTNVPKTWETMGTQGEGVKVAVLDTGVDPDHPDLDLYSQDPDDPTYPGGWAEFDEAGQHIDSRPYDSSGHGTHVSGTVAGGNVSGVHIGVAPDATLIHGGVLTPEGGTLSAVLAGMQWAVEEDSDVISMSLGVEGNAPQLIEPVRNTEAAGTTVVAAIGNDGNGTSRSPGNIHETVAVGASNEQAEITEFSSGETIQTEEAWGPVAPDNWPEEYVVPDVAAPGAQVVSSVPNRQYRAYSGTSMAAPHVAGVIALSLSVNDTQSVTEVKKNLAATAWKPNGAQQQNDPRYGSGIVDAYQLTSMHASTIQLSNAEGTSGENVTIAMNTTATDVAGYAVNVSFDPDTVRIQSVSGSDIADPTVNSNNEQGWVHFTASQAQGADQPDLAELEFELTGSTSSSSSLTFHDTDTQLVDSQGKQIPTQLKNGDITIKGPTITDYHLNRTSVAIDESLTITANASNPTENAEEVTANLSVNDTRVQTKSVRVAPGESTTITFQTLFENQGTRQITVNDLAPTTVEVAEAAIAVERVSTSSNSTASVDVTASGTGIAGYAGNLTFDSKTLTVTEVTGGDFGTPVANTNNKQGWTYFTASQPQGREDPTLATVVFDVGSLDNETSLSLDSSTTTLNGEQGSSLSVVLRDGAIISADQCAIQGDVTGDGEFTSGDITVTQRYIVGLPIEGSFNTDCADLTGDGRISAQDVTLMQRKLVGL